MRRKSIKVSHILFYYSLSVTVTLLIIFIIFISYISIPQSNLPQYFVMLNNENVTYLVHGGNMGIPFNKINPSIMTNKSLETYYISDLLKQVPLLITCLVGMLIAGTVILSKVLNNQYEKQTLFLAQQLSLMNEESALGEEHPAIVKAYREIKEKLDSYTLDYIRLSAYVTHEQKNILSLLRAKLQLSKNPALTAEVDKVTNSLDDILTLSVSKENRKTELVDTALVCANVCDEYRKVYPKITFGFDDEADNFISARELWINRAVSNLVSNAIKYGGDGEIHVFVTNKKGSIIISVSDEGDGIDETVQDKLFDFQYRVGKLKKDGYGIGLSLVRHVCELCNGLCWVESRKEGGTTFSMIFPEALTLD